MESTSPDRTPVRSDPAAYLPHRSPFVFLDRIVSREPGAGATGIKCVTHETGTFPQVFLIESMAQLGGVAAAGSDGEGGFLAAIDRAEFLREVSAGDRIVITVKIVKSFGRLFLLEGEASVDGERIASATLTLGIGAL